MRVHSLSIILVAIFCTAANVACDAMNTDHDRHQAEVTGLSFLPHGSTFLSSGFEGSLKVWDSAMCHCLKTLELGHGSITQIAVSTDGKVVACANWDGTVAIWDIASWGKPAILSVHTAPVLSVLFSPDGKTFASAGRDRRVLIWDIDSKTVQRELPSQTAWVECLTYSPDGSFLVSGNWDGVLKVWDVSSGKELRSIQAHDDAVLSMKFSPDGKLLVTGAQDRDPLKFWDTTTWQQVGPAINKEVFRMVPSTVIESVRAVVFLSDDELITASTDFKIRVWNVKNRTVSAEWASQGRGWVSRLALSPDHQVLVSGDLPGEVKCWKLADVLPAARARQTEPVKDQ
jgi:WD40 repeat protein